jgi:tetratricopeptide (TPR) repeat protein
LLFLGVTLVAIAPVLYTIRASHPAKQAVSVTGGQKGNAIVVETVPEGASIYVDYLFQGISPLNVQLPDGGHLIEGRLNGYRDAAELVDAARVQSGRVVLELQGVPTGTLKVQSTPTAAYVYVDGVFAGFTPIEAKARAGRHLVEIEKANHNPVQEWVAVEPDKALVVTQELQDRVLEYLLAAIKSDPDSIAHYTDLAHYYFIQDKLDLAAETYKKALFASYKPDASKEDTERLDKEIKKHQHWPGKDTKAFNVAMEAAYQEAAQRFPGSLKALRAKSAEMERRRDLDGALAVWKQGTAAAPDNAMIWTEYARLAMRARKFEEAMEGLGKAVETAKGDTEALAEIVRTVHSYYRMFPVKDDQGKFLTFLLEKVLNPALAKENLAKDVKSEALFRRAINYEYMEKNAEAVADYKAAIEVQDAPVTRADWRERLAILLTRTGDNEEAKAQYRLAMQEVPDQNRKNVIQRRLEQLENQGK